MDSSFGNLQHFFFFAVKQHTQTPPHTMKKLTWRGSNTKDSQNLFQRSYKTFEGSVYPDLYSVAVLAWQLIATQTNTFKNLLQIVSNFFFVVLGKWWQISFPCPVDPDQFSCDTMFQNDKWDPDITFTHMQLCPTPASCVDLSHFVLEIYLFHLSARRSALTVSKFEDLESNRKLDMTDLDQGMAAICPKNCVDTFRNSRWHPCFVRIESIPCFFPSVAGQTSLLGGLTEVQMQNLVEQTKISQSD